MKSETEQQVERTPVPLAVGNTVQIEVRDSYQKAPTLLAGVVTYATWYGVMVKRGAVIRYVRIDDDA